MKKTFVYVLMRDLYRFLKAGIVKVASLPLLLCPIKTNKVVMCSYYGKGYGDNPKYIANELLKTNKFDIVWALNRMNANSPLPDGIRSVRYGSLKYLYELCTAKVWIDNSRKSIVPIKRKNQFYIQTWHGSLGLKQVEKHAAKALPYSYCVMAKHDSKNADLFLSNCKWLSDLYKDAFWYNGDILEVGMPGNDILVNTSSHETIKRNFYAKFKLDCDINILLYAPTFRKDSSVDCYSLDYDKIIKKLEDVTGKKWVAMVRLHPNIEDLAESIKCGDKVINVTKYSDLKEILISASIVVTDYSSVMFDAAYMKKPVFLFAADVDEYSKDRGFNFKFDEIPFCMSRNNKQLLDAISAYDSKKYLKKLDNFFKKVGLNESGNSSAIVAKKIMEVCGLNEK